MLIKRNSTVLFQGDSITDASRIRDVSTDHGRGYAMMAASWFNALHPELNVNFINRGISGNRVRDLKTRWKEDCLDLKPDVVSIMIGINDTWRRFDECRQYTPAEDYKRDYREILTQIKEKSDAVIVICEPFMQPFTEEQRMLWREDLDPKIEAARELALEFKTLYIPLDEIFAKAATQRSADFWFFDGVHPTQYGHALIAQRWLTTLGVL